MWACSCGTFAASRGASCFPAERRTVVQFRFSDARPGERSWWLVMENGEIDLCRDDPGHDVTLIVESSVRALTEIWNG